MPKQPLITAPLLSKTSSQPLAFQKPTRGAACIMAITKMNQLVRFLFGHEQAVFTNGRFGFDVRPGAVILVLIVLLAGVFIYFIYLRPRVRLSKGTTATLIALRAALLAADGRLAVAAGRGCLVSDSAQQLCRDGD